MRSLSILCYHGVVDSIPNGFNSSGKHLNLRVFERQIDFLAKNFEIVTMKDVENFYQNNTDLPKKSVAVTFDDGYANNLKYAHEVLEKKSMKATVYIATGYIGSDKLMWSDEIELLILSINAAKFKVMLDHEITFDGSTIGSKLIALNQIKKYLKKSPPEMIGVVISSLSKYVEDYKKGIIPDLHDFLNWNQVRQMKSSNTWDVGAHTVDHFSLGTLSPSAGITQIKNSIDKIAKELKSDELPLFSFPEGQSFDMPVYSVKYLRNLGFKTAPSAISGKNYLSKLSNAKPMRLRRYLVGFEGLDFPWQF